MSNSTPFYAELLGFAEQLKHVDCKPRLLQLEIDGLMYTSSKLPASTGVQIWPQLISVFGEGITTSIATASTDETFAASALVSIMKNIADEGVLPLIRDLLQRVQCNKLYTTQQPGPVVSDFDEHFAGEYMHMIKVAGFALVHNLKGPTLGVS